jgi:hypothetical protein
VAGKERYSVGKVIDALRQTKGMKGPAARMLGCSWNTVDGYEKRHPTVAEVIREEREGMTDVAELSLYRKVQEGEAWAVCFYLKTQGKSRGYVERSEVTGKDGEAIRLEHALTPEAVTLLDELAATKRSRVFGSPN